MSAEPRQQAAAGPSPAVPPTRLGWSPAGLALLFAGVNTVLTTVHHVHGALLYDAPYRYHAVLLALGLLAVAGAAYAVHRSAADRTVQRAAWWVFWTTTLLGFVGAFGLFEGFTTHVIGPIVSGYGPDEPFDLFFEATGVLQVAPAAITAVLLVRALREHRRAVPRVDG